jgi:hypothetical protein
MIKKKIDIVRANKIYNILVRFRELKQNKLIKKLEKNPYLILSAIFERDIFNHEICTNNTLFLIGYLDYEIDSDLEIILTKNMQLAFILGRVIGKSKKLDFSIFKLSQYYLKNLFKFLIIFSYNLVDLSLIIIYSLKFISFIRPIRNNIFSKFNNKKNIKELYTCHYNYKKGNKSPSYNYPDFSSRESKLAFITSFDGYRFIFKGLIQTSFSPNIVNALDFISLSQLFKSFLSLIHLYLFDFSQSFSSYGYLVFNINSIKIISRKFYYLLTYYSNKNIALNSNFKDIYIWAENQLHTKVLSYSLSKIIKDNNKNINIFSYFGFNFNKNYYPHYIPSKFELSNFIWGQNKFLFNSQDSLNEMILCFPQNSEVKFALARPTLFRYGNSFKKKKSNLTLKNLRLITFFSNAGIENFYLMVKKFILKSKEFDFNNVYYVRLHPSLNVSLVKNRLIPIVKKYNKRFIIIDSTEESLDYSIRNSEYCVFSDSSIINIAISLNSKIYSVRTSFTFNAPLNDKYKDYEKIKFI